MSSQSPSAEFAKEFAKAQVERWRDRTRGAAHLSWQSLIPVAFVLCWASGFVVPRAFAPYIEPLTFVAIRNGAGMSTSIPMSGPGGGMSMNAGGAGMSMSAEGPRAGAPGVTGGGAPGGGAPGGGGIEASLQQAQEMNLYYLQIQQQVQQQNQTFSTLSNVMKAEHDTVKNAIGNIR